MNEPTLYVGIDFSRGHVQVALLDGEEHLLGRSRRFTNTYPGYRAFRAWLAQQVEQEKVRRVVIGGEATNVYWQPYFQQMDQEGSIAGVEQVLYAVNPRWVRWFKKSHTPAHKDDDWDAQEIGRYVHRDPPAVIWHADQHWLALRQLTRLRFHLSHGLSREKNLALQFLFLLQPSYTAKHPFSNVFGVTSQKLLTDPQLLQELEALPVEELALRLQELAHGSLPDPGANARDLREVARDCFPLDAPLRLPLQDGLETLLATINHFQDQIRKVDQLIAEQLQREDYPQVALLQSIPGLGPVLAAGIAAEIGDLARFQDLPVWDEVKKRYRPRTHQEVNDALHKYAGLWWKHTQSGAFSADEHHLSREGNSYLRYYLVQAAECLRRHLASFTVYYQTKFAQSHSHRHKRALALTACQVLDLCVALLRHNKEFQEKEVATPSLHK